MQMLLRALMTPNIMILVQLLLTIITIINISIEKSLFRLNVFFVVVMH